MSIEKPRKLKNLLSNWLDKTIATTHWLLEQGISAQLVKRYVESGWVEPIGHGAFKKLNDKVLWQSGVHALQAQLKLPVHVGGLSALAFHGASHYVRMGQETLFLFSAVNVFLPKWFTAFKWEQPIFHVKTTFLSAQLGINVYPYHDMSLQISTIERAILECLYLSPKVFDLLECYQIIASLHGLRPNLMQVLLENCSSIKVKRLFLFMADKAKLPVMKHLKLDNIDLGKGARSIVQHGQYNAKYRLTLPKELLNDNKTSI